MENVSTEYIIKAIDEIVDLIYIKDPVDFNPLLELLHKKEIKKCIKEIALCLGLPVEIDLAFVSPSDKVNNFETSDIVKTDYRGVGSEGIIAQVLIPKSIPPYGSSSLVNYLIKVKVSKNCIEHPKTFISIISHELSHILLAAYGSSQADNEVYTDLTPLVLGFSEIVSIGRKIEDRIVTQNLNVTTTTTNTTTYGYLNDEQFNFANRRIDEIRKEHILLKKTFLKKISRYKKICNLRLDYLNLFKQTISLLQLLKNVKFKQDDTNKIIGFYNPTLLIDLDSMSAKSKERSEKLYKYHDNFKLFNRSNLEILSKNAKNTEDFTFELQNNIKELKSNLHIITKYVSFFDKLKIVASSINLKIKELIFIKLFLCC